MSGEYSLSDIASVTNANDGFGGGNGAWWLIVLFLFAMGGRGFELDVFSGDSLISHLSTSDSVNVHFGKILLMPVVEIKKCHEE